MILDRLNALLTVIRVDRVRGYFNSNIIYLYYISFTFFYTFSGLTL